MSDESTQRREAYQRIKAKRGFWNHVAIFVIVNTFLIVIWALNDAGTGNFWPGWVLGAWGLALAFNAWSAYGPRRQITDADVDREIRRDDSHG